VRILGRSFSFVGASFIEGNAIGHVSRYVASFCCFTVCERYRSLAVLLCVGSLLVGLTGCESFIDIVTCLSRKLLVDPFEWILALTRII